MKNLICFVSAVLTAFLLAAPAGAQSFRSMSFGESDSQTVLHVRSDGSCDLTNAVTAPRKSFEQQVTAWEQFSKMSEGSDDEDSAVVTPTDTKPETKSLSDDELAAKVREMYGKRRDAEQDDSVKIDSVEVSSNSVRVVMTRSYASLKELLSQSPYIWGPSALMVEDARAEFDTNKNLRITFNPGKESSFYANNLSRQWKSGKMHFEWKLVLPGKILTSDFPNKEETSSGLSLHSDKPETVGAAVKLIGAPLVITAEPGGIQLSESLETSKLVQTALGQSTSQPDLAITEAGAGFLAEPSGITLSTLYYFPEGEKSFKNRPEASMLAMSPTGTVVTTKLFPPKGREIKSVGEVRVTAARDDQGRSIGGISANAENPGDSRSVNFRMNQFENGAPARLELHLALPALDAKAIEELECEAVVLTLGSWKEMAITNIQAATKKEIDLGEVVPGAKLIIDNIVGKKPRKTIEATLEGPKEVSQIELRLKQSGMRGAQSYMNERRTKDVGNKTTRTVTVQGYEMQGGSEMEGGFSTLLVRYPQDLKRERVRFKLTALDLL